MGKQLASTANILCATPSWFVVPTLDIQQVGLGLYPSLLHQTQGDVLVAYGSLPQKHRLRLVATDGAFSMDGDIAPLREICQLAQKYDALVFIDECHATGFLGPNGR